MMGGDVTVASQAGKGSVFTVRLPGRTGKIGSRLRAANPDCRDVLFLLSRPEPREGLTARISIQNNSGLPQGPSLRSEAG